MRRIAAFLLGAKAWQLALLFYGPMIAVWSIPISRNPTVYRWIDVVMTVLVLWSVLLTFIWIWVVGSYFGERSNLSRRKRILFVLTAGTTLLVTALYMVVILIETLQWGDLVHNDYVAGFISLFFDPLSIIGLLSSSYMVGYVSKRIVEAEFPQTRIAFVDFLGAMFAIWFFPIGIWFVQPRLNRLVSGLKGPGSNYLE